MRWFDNIKMKTEKDRHYMWHLMPLLFTCCPYFSLDALLFTWWNAYCSLTQLVRVCDTNSLPFLSRPVNIAPMFCSRTIVSGQMGRRWPDLNTGVWLSSDVHQLPGLWRGARGLPKPFIMQKLEKIGAQCVFTPQEEARNNVFDLALLAPYSSSLITLFLLCGEISPNIIFFIYRILLCEKDIWYISHPKKAVMFFCPLIC